MSLRSASRALTCNKFWRISNGSAIGTFSKCDAMPEVVLSSTAKSGEAIAGLHLLLSPLISTTTRTSPAIGKLSVSGNMRATFRLLQHASRITLFTRPNCSLCEDAKGVLSRVWDTRPFEYKEVDVMEAGNETWKNNYEFDVPVVRSLHLPATDLSC